MTKHPHVFPHLFSSSFPGASTNCERGHGIGTACFQSGHSFPAPLLFRHPFLQLAHSSLRDPVLKAHQAKGSRSSSSPSPPPPSPSPSPPRLHLHLLLPKDRLDLHLLHHLKSSHGAWRGACSLPVARSDISDFITVTWICLYVQGIKGKWIIFFHQQTFEKLSMTKYTTCSGCSRLIRKCAIFTSETDLGNFFTTTYNIYSGCYRFNRNMWKLLGQPQPKCFRLGLGEKKMCNLYFTSIFLKSFS